MWSAPSIAAIAEPIEETRDENIEQPGVGDPRLARMNGKTVFERNCVQGYDPSAQVRRCHQMSSSMASVDGFHGGLEHQDREGEQEKKRLENRPCDSWQRQMSLRTMQTRVPTAIGTA